MLWEKKIKFCGVDVILSCDGKCSKAWGMNSRPRDTDGEYLSDDDLPDAPIDPGTYEGGDAKPASPADMNRWCARECERSCIVDAVSDTG